MKGQTDNGQQRKKKQQQTPPPPKKTYDPQNIIQKTKDRATRTPLKQV